MAMEVDEDDVWGAVATSPSASPPPAISTALSLNTRPSFFAAAAASPSSFSAAANAFAPIDAGPTAAAGAATGGPVERRKTRMIMNRESASRSRARKQAHVTQIETEVMELREANEQLRLKYEQLKATVKVSVPVKRTLQRVLSAPF